MAYLLACQWQRIAQEEAFPGRCAEAGDDLGSAVVTARLARDLMRLCLLMHRRYDWHTRQRNLCAAYEAVTEMHNQSRFTAPLDTGTRWFHDRPYQVIDAARFTMALLEVIADPQIRTLPPIGAIDQFTDSTDATGNMSFLRPISTAVQPPATSADA